MFGFRNQTLTVGATTWPITFWAVENVLERNYPAANKFKKIKTKLWFLEKKKELKKTSQTKFNTGSIQRKVDTFQILV